VQKRPYNFLMRRRRVIREVDVELLGVDNGRGNNAFREALSSDVVRASGQTSPNTYNGRRDELALPHTESGKPDEALAIRAVIEDSNADEVRTPKPTPEAAPVETAAEPVAQKAASEPDQAAPGADEDAPGSALSELTCTTVFWRGYRKAAFFARIPDVSGEQLAVAESPLFRAEGNGIPERTEEAQAAYHHLREELLRAGWEPLAPGRAWYEEIFRLPLRAAGEPGPE
jgi:hypothetical protein